MPIRDARVSDASAITAIYNDAVENTTAIWNETVVDVENRVAWMSDRRVQGFPILVAVDDADRAVGYASYGPWRPHDGYRHTVEHSVYVRADQRGNGLGRALLVTLIERARAQGLHAMIAGIDATNTGSIRLHETLGFADTGTMREVGTKFGRWLDLTFMQLVLDDRPAPAVADR